METAEFARHLLSFTVDLNYVLAAAGMQAENPLLHFMLSSYDHVLSFKSWKKQKIIILH